MQDYGGPVGFRMALAHPAGILHALDYDSMLELSSLTSANVALTGFP
jgi:hypothetical protein